MGKTLKRGPVLGLDLLPNASRRQENQPSPQGIRRERFEKVIEFKEWESSLMILSKSWRNQVIRTVTFGEVFKGDRIVLGRIQSDWGLRFELAHLCNCKEIFFECEKNFCKCKEERGRKLEGGSVRSTRGHRKDIVPTNEVGGTWNASVPVHWYLTPATARSSTDHPQFRLKISEPLRRKLF